MKNHKTFALLTAFTLLLSLGCRITKSIVKEELVKNFSEKQLKLISAATGDNPMRVFKINNYQDSILLRTASTYVNPDPNDKILSTFIDRLFATVRDSLSLGVGIAAPQVGILKNIIWVQRFDKEDFPFEVYLNPKIVQYSQKKQNCQEGCLSIPGRSDITKTRAYAILLEYDRQDGSHHLEMVEDFTAVIFQHEIDHLHGILYLDHLADDIANAKK
jgi:peptide deformylase